MRLVRVMNVICLITILAVHVFPLAATLPAHVQQDIARRTITAIVVEGNAYVSTDAILNKIPYRVGQQYNPLAQRQLIRQLMDMGYFTSVVLEAELQGDDGIILYVVVVEKKLLRQVKFEGNKNLGQKEILKKVPLGDLHAIDEHDLQKYSIQIKKLYKDKGYHHVQVRGSLEPAEGKVDAVFRVQENKKSLVKRVFFEGNKAFPAKQLRALIFTREDWVGGFLDRAGMYQPDALEADKYMIEHFYQSNGYLHAKVVEAKVVENEQDNYVNVTFCVDEGAQYTVSQVAVPGNDVLPETYLLERIPLRAGQLYSREKIRQTIDALRLIWGQHGYINADIEPAIEPDEDHKTVKISFYSELGDKVYLGRIRIIGNQKTRDKVIRRQLLLDEGDLLTTNKLDESKTRVEGLGYFEQQNGVNWKINKVNKDIADLDLMVQEVKTGRLDAQIGFGGSPKDLQNPTESLRVGGSLSDTNLFGLGIAFNLSGEISKQERQLLFNITQPWLFDRPIYVATDVAFKRSVYEDMQLTTDEVKEQLAQGVMSLGWVARSLDTKFVCQSGIEGLHYSKVPTADLTKVGDLKEQAEFQAILNDRFPQGQYGWLGGQASQDYRNHPLHPSRGYQWLTQTKIGISHERFGYWKVDFDASYYAPLINERDLVFAFHTHLGIVTAFMGRSIPFRELYHIGGPASVRGFLFGQIGPMYKGIDSIGAKKAFWLNSELLFPIAPDFSIKGVLFYDGGAGWDTPRADLIAKKRLAHNGFDYRHSVGFGLRILRPSPIRIDWGFKLDKRKGEKASEVHLSMSHDF